MEPVKEFLALADKENKPFQDLAFFTGVKAMFKHKKGFTLSELLVSLSVLGLIAAIAIPSVYKSVKERQNIALFREAFSTLANASYEGYQKGEIYDRVSYINYLEAHLNATAICDAGEDDSSKPCNVSDFGDRTNYVRIALPTGSIVAVNRWWDLESGLASVVIFNEERDAADDDGWLTFNYSDATISNTMGGEVTLVRPGEIRGVGMDQDKFLTSYGLN